MTRLILAALMAPLRVLDAIHRGTAYVWVRAVTGGAK